MKQDYNDSYYALLNYEVQQILEEDAKHKRFKYGDVKSTGNNYTPYQQNITYNGEYVGQKMIGGPLGHQYYYVAPDVDYGNNDGWGNFKSFDEKDEFEQYVIDNYDKIQQLLHSGVDFD